MSAKCNTCNGVPISTNCLRYEGNDLFISSELEDKRDFNELIEKLSTELNDLKKLVNTPIDAKTLDVGCSVKTLPQFVQYLIDKQVQQKPTATTTTTSSTSNLISLGTGCSTGNCGDNKVSIDTAFMIICAELAQIKEQLNQTNSLYIPNV